MPVQRPPTPYEPSLYPDDDREICTDDEVKPALCISPDCDDCTFGRDITDVGVQVSGGGDGSAMSMSRQSSTSSSQTATSSRSSMESTPPTSPSTIGSLTPTFLEKPTIRVRFTDKPEGTTPRWVTDATATTATVCSNSETIEAPTTAMESCNTEAVPTNEATRTSPQVVSLTELRKGKIRQLVEEHGYVKIHQSPILMRKMLGRATLEELPDDRHYSIRVLIFQDEGFKSSAYCNCTDMFVDFILDSARSMKLLELEAPISRKKWFRQPCNMAYLNNVSDGGDYSEKEALWSYKFPKTTIQAVGIKTRAPPKTVPPVFFDDITPRMLLWAPDIILVRVSEDDFGWERQLNYMRLMNKKIVVVIDAVCAEVAEVLRLKVVTRVTTWQTGHLHDVTGPRDMGPGGVIERYNSTRGNSKLVSSTKWLLSPTYINFFFVDSEDQLSFIILHEFLAVFCRAKGVFSFAIQDNKCKKLRYCRNGYVIDPMTKVRFNADVCEFGSDNELSDDDIEEYFPAFMPDNNQHSAFTMHEISKTEYLHSLKACAELVDMAADRLPLAYIVSARFVPEDGLYLDVVGHCGYFNKKKRYALGPMPGTNTFYPIVVRKIISKCTRQRMNVLRAGENAVVRISIPEYNGDSLIPTSLITLLNHDPRAFRRMAFSVGYNPHPTITRLFLSAARFFTRAKSNKILQLAPVVLAVIILDSQFGQFKTSGQDVLKPGEFLMIQSGAKAKLVRLLGRVRGYRAICVRLTTDNEEKDYLWSKLPANLHPSDCRISYHCDEEADYFYEGERLTISEIVDNGNFEFDAVRYSGTVDSVTYNCSA
ncbi:uncharacterized protein V1513DRAFT_459080 [Lipomyces chichibuensis]|uniref:uncharacterized protein n=1 Tax=Lipomyces chichibuensis TaxID=1546026 RepID=UPI00334342BC